MIEKFPKMPEEDKTLFLLGKSYLELDQGEKATEALNKIVNEYPRSPHYKEAKAILDKGITGKAISLHKTKIKESKKKAEKIDEDDEVMYYDFWWWEGDDGTGAAASSRVIAVTDERDWGNQIHVGRRLMREGLMSPEEASHG